MIGGTVESLVLSGPCRYMPFNDAIAGRFAVVRDDLELRGEVVGANILLIALIALAHGLVLATDDTAFGRVTGHHIEDWTVANVSRSVIWLRPLQMLVLEVECPLAVELVKAVEEFDFGTVAEAERVVHAADIGGFVSEPFVGSGAVPAASFVASLLGELHFGFEVFSSEMQYRNRSPRKNNSRPTMAADAAKTSLR